MTITQGDNKYQALTGDDGRYQFTSVETGTWQCKVEMFGFAAGQAEVKVPEGPAQLDIPLEMRAFDAPAAPSVITENKPATAAPTSAPAPTTEAKKSDATKPAGAAPAPAATAANRRGNSGNAGSQRRGQGGPGGQGGGNFQNLSLTESADAQMMGGMSSDPSAVGGDVAAGADQTLVLNGSLSRGMEEAQANDSFLMRNGFGFGGPGGGFGGPGGPGGPGGGQGLRQRLPQRFL